MGQFQDRSLLLEECPRRRGGCRAGARPCAPECQRHRRRRRRGGCCSGARQPCGAAVPGSRGPSPGTPSWRWMVRMQPRRHDGSIGLWNNPCNVKMSGVAYCSTLPVCGTTRSYRNYGKSMSLKYLNPFGRGITSVMRRQITLKTYNATRRIKIMDERIWVAGHRVSKDDPQAAPLWWECCVKAGGWVGGLNGGRCFRVKAIALLLIFHSACSLSPPNKP